jgi:hypothetical protein
MAWHLCAHNLYNSAADVMSPCSGFDNCLTCCCLTCCCMLQSMLPDLLLYASKQTELVALLRWHLSFFLAVPAAVMLL